LDEVQTYPHEPSSCQRLLLDLEGQYFARWSALHSVRTECSQLLVEGPGLDGKSESTVLHSWEAWKTDETRTRCQGCLNCNKITRHLGNLDILTVVVRSVSFSVLVFLAQTCHWGMRDSVPGIVDEGVGKLG
jgi:hypothetical protein